VVKRRRSYGLFDGSRHADDLVRADGCSGRAIRRATFRSVKELTAAIGAFIDAYNDRC